MSTLRFVLVWALLITIGWLLLGALAGAVIALLILAVGSNPAAWVLVAGAVTATIIGCCDYVRSHR